MAALDFPSSPTLNQIYTANGSSWRWDGTTWVGANTLPVTSGGTGTNTAFTAGSVVFAGTSGTYTQDNANFFFNNTNDSLGIGTASPNIGGFSKAITIDSSNSGLELSSGGTIQAYLSANTNGAVLTGIGANGIRFFNAASGAESEKMRLDTAGNLGIGVTPSAWSGAKALQLGTSNVATTALWDLNNNTFLTNGAYWNGSNYIYVASSFPAARYVQNGGTHTWSYAAGGTAGNAITFTQAMTLDASGRLGVGVAPSAWDSAYAVTQVGSLGLRGAASSNIAYLSANSYFDGTNYKYIATGISTAYGQESGVHSWYGAASGTAGTNITYTERMRLSATGNLGVSVAPSAWNTLAAVQVPGGAIAGYAGGAGNNQVGLYNNNYFDGSNYKYITSDTAQRFVTIAGEYVWFNAASGTAGNNITFIRHMTLDANGRLGIGTATPSYPIDVSASTAVIRATGTSATPASLQLVSTGVVAWNMQTPGSAAHLSWSSDGTERMRLDAAGRLGTTSGIHAGSLTNPGAGSSAYILTATQTASDYIGRLYNTNATPFGLQLHFSGASPNSTTPTFLNVADSTATRLDIRSNGGIANYSANNVNLSDERVKTDIQPAPSYWDMVKALEVVTFKYKDQTHDDVNIGFIAQQVETVNPVWVDTDGIGETPEDGVPLKTIYTDDVQNAAFKTLQEAMARIEALEAELIALKSQ